MAQTIKIRFSNKDARAFVSDVRGRVAAYFKETGRSRKADWRMVLKTFVILGGTAGSYALILSGWLTLGQMWVMTFVLGMGMAGIGFSVAHDALHGAYSSKNWVNAMLGFSFDMMGANGYMWKITHNVIHHTYTNIHDVDEDLTVSPLIRLSPDARHYWFHRYQHLYGFLAYGLATVNWLFAKDFQQFMKSDIGPYVDKKHPVREIAILVLMKAATIAWMIVIPLLVLDITWWQFLIGFLTAHMTAGIILGVIFQLAHVVEGPEFPLPDDGGNMEYAWLVHEMRTTANFAGRNKLLSWYIGGLNYQIEHHLFPQTCSVHYPAIAPIVQAAAAEHGVPYHYNETLSRAIASHYRMLKKLGPEAGGREVLVTA
ncbi:MAG: acyl-CoA desaturase [Rhodothermales bacterium]|nr:acyl-CoA desaturase [Rhodothermales bacterium]MBO6779613.1 acyl-CoA desaturase [Rhodothermales bacterium]